MAELHLLRVDEVVYVRPVGSSPVYIGRAPTNDLVLTDSKVSGRHAVVWVGGGEIKVEDLTSKNGTFINDRKVEGQAVLQEGDVLRLGRNTLLRVVGAAPGMTPSYAGPLVVEDVAAGVRYPITSDRFTIGADTDADLVLSAGPMRAATLVLHEGGEVWLGTDEDERELTLDERFDVAGVALAVHELTDERTRTEFREATKYPYRLVATLEGPTGPQATLVHLGSGQQHVVTTEHRATLLYLLARQASKDLGQDGPGQERGWVPDEEVAIGIWGRDRHRLEANNFHVLVCRVRKELKHAGFDAWFIEKKRKHIRARLDQVEIV